MNPLFWSSRIASMTNEEIRQLVNEMDIVLAMLQREADRRGFPV